MTRAGREPDRKLKSGKKRKERSKRWLQRQLNDPYVKRAKDEGWRSRAAFKLLELDDRLLESAGFPGLADRAPDSVLATPIGRGVVTEFAAARHVR